jgi:alkylation response protein AidB-like acyl-CoA dehydrogenase
MQAALDDALAYTAQRVVFGRPIAGFGLPRAMLGRMIVQVASARRLSYRAARLLSEGQGSGQMEASLAKLYACRNAEFVTRDAVQLFGGMGYATETRMDRAWRDARLIRIGGGTDEVMREIISKTMGF